MEYKVPTTTKEYWGVINKNWDGLYSILSAYLDLDSHYWIDKTYLDLSLGEYLVSLKDQQNQRLIRAFHAAWFNAPDTTGIWEHKAWSILCDLCAEENNCLNS